LRLTSGSTDKFFQTFKANPALCFTGEISKEWVQKSIAK